MFLIFPHFHTRLIMTPFIVKTRWTFHFVRFNTYEPSLFVSPHILLLDLFCFFSIVYLFPLAKILTSPSFVRRSRNARLNRAYRRNSLSRKVVSFSPQCLLLVKLVAHHTSRQLERRRVIDGVFSLVLVPSFSRAWKKT